MKCRRSRVYREAEDFVVNPEVLGEELKRPDPVLPPIIQNFKLVFSLSKGLTISNIFHESAAFLILHSRIFPSTKDDCCKNQHHKAT